MAPKRVAVKSLAGDSAKRLKLHDSKKKPADQSVEDSLLASDEPDAEADGDDMKKTRNLPQKQLFHSKHSIKILLVN